MDSWTSVATDHEDNTGPLRLVSFLGDGTGDFPTTLDSFSFDVSGFTGLGGDLSSGDLNEDGNVDIVSFTTQGPIVMLGDGNGNFTATDRYLSSTVEQRKRDGYIVDMDEDGHLDLVQFTRSSSLIVRRGLGDGTFADPIRVDQEGTTAPVVNFVDIDHDGHLDLVYEVGEFSHNPEDIAIFAGKRDGLVDVTSADLDGDGAQEVLAINENNDRVKLFVGDNLGGLTRQFDLQTGRAPKAIITTDLNNDGQLEIVTANRAGRNISVFSGSIESVFLSAEYALGNGPIDVQAADFNGDGFVDLVALDDSSRAMWIFVGNGTTSLDPPVALALGDTPEKLFTADVDSDGNLDVIVSLPESNRLMILNGDGAFGFDTPVYVGTSSSPYDVVALDLNDDGNVDLATTIPDEDSVSVFYGLGNQQFSRAQNIQVGDTPEKIHLADADQDGRTDLIVSNRGDDTVSVIYNRFDPNEVYRYDADAIDPDNDPLTYSIVRGPGGLIINSQTGALLWAASPSQVGVHDVTISADDGRGGVATQSFKIEVVPAQENSAPIIASEPASTIGSNQLFQHQLDVLDADNDALRFRLLDGPEGATIDASTGEINWDGRSQGLHYGRAFTGGVINVPDSESLNPSSITVEGWFKLNGLPRFNILMESQNYRVMTNETDQSLRVDLNFPGSGDIDIRFFVPITPEVDRWYHLALTYDETTGVANLFVDGELGGFGATSEPQPLDTSESTTIIGRQNGSTQATFDNYRIWNFARSSEEIQDGLNRQYEDDRRIVLDYRFEGPDTHNVRDHSIYGNEGFRVSFSTVPLITEGLSDPGIFDFVVSVEDGRGGFDQRNFQVEVVPQLNASIRGTLFEDLDGDGVQDDGSENPVESGLANWQIFIDANRNGFPDVNETQVLTDADGNYLIDGLLDSDYPIGVSPVAGYDAVDSFVASSVRDIVLELDAENATKYDIPVVESALGQIRGQLASELGDPIAYWKVYADMNSNGLRDSTEPMAMTDRLGNFAITGLEAGTYTLRADLPAGWINVSNDNGRIVTLGADEISRGNDLAVQPGNTSVENGLHFVTTPLDSIEARQVYRYDSLAVGIQPADVFYDLSLAPEGMSIDTSTGLIVWRPTVSQTGDHLVIVRAQDLSGSVALQSFQIEVIAPNTSPTIVSTPDSNGFINKVFAYDVRAQDAERESLTFAILVGPSSASMDPVSGQLRWTPDSAGTTSFEISVTDDSGNETTQRFDVQVSDNTPLTTPNQVAPLRSSIGLGQQYLSQAIGIDAIGRPLSWTLVSGPEGMTISDNGVISWTPTTIGTESVELLATNVDGETDLVTFDIEVVSRAVITTPSIVSTPIESTILGSTYRYDVQVEAIPGALLAYSLLQAPAGMSIDSDRGTIRWIPEMDQLGEVEVSLEVTNSDGQTDTQDFTLRVTRFGGPPLILSTPPTETHVGGSFLYSIDAIDAEDDPLTYRLLTAPEGMAIVESTGEIAWTPAGEQVGIQEVVIEVVDGAGGAATQAFTIRVSAGAINQVPIIESVAPRFAAVNSAYNYQIDATDPEGTSLTYEISRGPAGMTVDANGAVSWQPGNGQNGKFVVTIRVTDQGGATAVESFELDVLAENRDPVVVSEAPTSAVQGVDFQYDVLVEDADLDPLTFLLSESPAGASINAFGQITWSTEDASLGIHSFEVVIKDPRGGQAIQTFDVELVADTLAPVISLIERPNNGLRNIFPWMGPFVVYARAIDDVAVASLTLTANGKDIPLSANGTATFSFEDWTFQQIVATATAIDSSGNVSQQTVSFDYDLPEGWSGAGVDDIPTAIITSPTEAGAVTGVVSIIGTANHEDFAAYQLSYRRVDETSFTQILRSDSAVDNGELGRWDTTLLQNDEYIIRLEVATTGGVVNVVEQNVGVAGELKLGNYQLQFTDLVVPVVGIPVEVTRIYDTLQSDQQGDFGFGWRLEFRDTGLTVGLPPSGLEDIGIFPALRPGVKVYLNVPGEGRQGYTFNPDVRVLPGFGGNNLVLARPRFTPDPGVTSTLSTGVSGYLQVNELGELFAPGGIPYNPASPDFGGAYVLTNREGITYRVDGVSGQLQSATDRNGNQVVFSDRGISAADGQVAVEFQRDVLGRIRRIVDGRGGALQYDYDPTGNLIASIDRNGNQTTFEYLNDPEHYLERVVDPLNRPTNRVEYDADGRLNRIFNIDGESLEISIDPDNAIEVITDSLGRSTIAEYNSLGKVARTTNALGGQVSYEYDSRGYLSSETNELGQTRMITNNAFGLPTQQTDFAGNAANYQYDGRDLVAKTDPLGSTTRYQRDENGNLLGIELANGTAYQQEVDQRGNIVSTTNPEGGVTTLSYNRFGLPTEISTDNGRREIRRYNENGETTEISIDVLVDGQVTQATSSIEYDANGNPVRQTAPDGGVTEFQFDANNRAVSQTGPTGIESVSVLDDAGEVLGLAVNGQQLVSRTRETDGSGQTVSGFTGEQTEYVFDALGRPVSKSTTVDGQTTTSSFSFDPTGKLAGISSSSGDSLDYEYDQNGNVVGFDDGSGFSVDSKYDALGRITESTDADGTTKYEYDETGNVTRIRFDDGTEFAFAYNRFGQIIQESIDGQLLREYEYDQQGQLTLVRDADQKETLYRYDVAGLVSEVIDGEGRSTKYEYDRRGLRTAIVRPDGSRSEINYDELGQIESSTDRAGNSTTVAYNEFGQQTSRNYSDGSSVVFNYDPVTRTRDSIVDAHGTTDYEYNSDGTLIRRTHPDGTSVSYEYDEFNRVSAIATPGGTRRYTYTNDGQIETVTDTNGDLTTYRYDANGQLNQVQYASGVTVTDTFDPLGQLTTQTVQDADGVVLERYVYRYNNRNLLEREDRLDGSSSEFTYDGGFRLASETHTTSGGQVRTITYTYDGAGNRLTMLDSQHGLTEYRYNDLDQLTTKTDGGVVTTYTYDDNGQVILEFRAADDQVAYEWDIRGLLIKVTTTTPSGVSVVEHEYDGLGIRVATITDGDEIRYLYDSNDQLPEVIEAYRPNGDVVSSATLGYGLVSETRGSETFNPVIDYRGSIRNAISSGGSLAGSVNYSGFGLAMEDTLPDLLQGFVGEMVDSSGLVYLRARYMSPELGRFVSADSLDVIDGEPERRNDYAYADSDPVNRLDPSGLSTLVEKLSALSVQNQIILAGLVQGVVGLVLRKVFGTRVWDGTTFSLSFDDFEIGTTFFSNKDGDDLNRAISLTLTDTIGKGGDLLNKISKNSKNRRLKKATDARKNVRRLGRNNQKTLKNLNDEVKELEALRPFGLAQDGKTGGFGDSTIATPDIFGPTGVALAGFYLSGSAGVSAKAGGGGVTAGVSYGAAATIWGFGFGYSFDDRGFSINYDETSSKGLDIGGELSLKFGFSIIFPDPRDLLD